MEISEIQSVFVLVVSMTTDMEIVAEAAEVVTMTTGDAVVTVVMTAAVRKCRNNQR